DDESAHTFLVIDIVSRWGFTIGEEIRERPQLQVDTFIETIGRNEMLFVARRLPACSTAIILLAASQCSAFAQKNYDTGATDTKIKIGNIMPYSGPASAYGVIGRTEAAYFNKINAEGGINGRKITFISYDDAYSPPKAVEQARKLVEDDEV